MKNFFKKLAFVLALAMVVTAIAPAAKASAATEPSFKYGSKKLYLGGDVTGNYGETYRFRFNDAKGYTAKWKSSNANVATVDAKTGNIQAVAVGKATITATLTKKGSDAVELKATVYVKQNAEKIGFGKMDAVKNMAVGDTGKVNVYRQVGTTKVWKQADKTVSTDVVKWTSSNPEVATVDKWGKVTAVAAGETTITATATQSEGSKAVVSKSYTVKVAAGLVDAKQASKNTINVTFAGDLSAVATKENVKVYSLVGSTKVLNVVKEVKFDATDKTKAVVTVYTDLVKGTEYVVEYGDTKAAFVGADLSKDAVASLKITTVEATKGVAKDIEVKAYDANGVEIPGDTVNSYITLSADSSSKYYLDEANKKITIFNSGDVAVVKATFHTYTYGTDYTENVITTTQEIKGVDAATLAMQTIDAFTVFTGTDPDFSKPNTALSVSDNDGSYRVAVKCTDNTSDKKTVKSTDENQIADDKFRFESSDTTVLVINGDTLYPVKEGSATVIVKYNKVTIGAYNVTIGAKRVVSDVQVTVSSPKLSFNTVTGTVDSLEVKVVTKDQYGADINVGVTLTPVSSNPNNAITWDTKDVNKNTTTFKFLGTQFGKEGSYQFKVEADNKQVRWAAFQVVDVASKNEAYFKLTNESKNVDTALNVDGSKTDSKDFEMSLASYTSDGYKKANYTLYADEDAARAAVSGSSVTYWAKISVPSSTNTTDAAKYISVTNGSVDVNPVVVKDGVATKMTTGTYTVQVFKYDPASKETNKSSAVTVANITITDTQTAPAVTVNKTISAQKTLAAALEDKDDIIKVEVNGKAVNAPGIVTANVDSTDYVVGKTDGTFFLKNVDVKITVKYGNETPVTYIHRTAVNSNVTLTK